MRKLVLGIAFGIGFAMQAMAANVSLGSAWDVRDEFIGGPGNFFTETWEAAAYGKLDVTDLYYYGDAYKVYVNGVLALTTATGGLTTGFGSGDADVAWADSNYSQGSVNGIMVGDLITIMATQLPDGFSDSTVAVRIDVPEPSSLALIGLALAGLGVSRRRQKA